MNTQLYGVWADAIAELVTYRYLGCRSVLGEGFGTRGTMPIRSALRDDGGLFAAPVAIAATARFTITEWARGSKDGRGILSLGVHSDDGIRTEEGWRFARRQLIPRTMVKLGVFRGQLHEAGLTR